MSPSEFYPRCPRHQGEELHSQYSYPHLKCSLSEEKSKFVPFNHRLSRALLHRVCLQVRCIPFTLFYILFLLRSSHFSCCVVLLWKGMQRYFNICITPQKRTEQKNNPLWRGRVWWFPINAKTKWLQSQAGFLPCLASSRTAKAVISVRQ